MSLALKLSSIKHTLTIIFYEKNLLYAAADPVHVDAGIFSG